MLDAAVIVNNYFGGKSIIKEIGVFSGEARTTLTETDFTQADTDVALPRTVDGYQPLCATYSDRAGAAFGAHLEAGVRKITDAIFGLPSLVVRELDAAALRPYDPHGTLFFNVNTPADFARAIDLGAEQDGGH